jgi:hypothetical protein
MILFFITVNKEITKSKLLGHFLPYQYNLKIFFTFVISKLKILMCCVLNKTIISFLLLVKTLKETDQDSKVEAELALVSNEVPVQCEHIQLVEITHQKDLEQVDKLVKTLHAHVRSIDKIITLERLEKEW